MKDTNNKKDTCYGCENLTSNWYTNGKLHYFCRLRPGIVRGDVNGRNPNRDPKRCENYRENKNETSIKR